MKTHSALSATGHLIILRTEYLLPVIAFTIPFLLSGPQWLTGTAVNCLLFLAAAKLSRKNAWPVIILPSLGAAGHGVLFGPFTLFLIFFLPFIWMGNWLLVRSFASLREEYTPAVAMGLSSLIKAAMLYLSALMYVRLGIVPAVFLTSMSMIQLITALAGGVIALVTLRFVLNHE
ncbi:MAG: hypothetical protein PHE68_05330 [Candidatus Peribacteraceae bacterium]|nr:hypothetical protein [Candidatus Peribacteraceae bacterium]MDD5074755.1 hypothetical protein [Candidatus Peribacteraceae bacterium]